MLPLRINARRRLAIGEWSGTNQAQPARAALPSRGTEVVTRYADPTSAKSPVSVFERNGPHRLKCSGT